MDVHFNRKLHHRTSQLLNCLSLLFPLVLALVLSASPLDWSRPLALFSWPRALFMLGMILTWHLIFSSLNLYESKRLEARSKQYGDAIKGTTLSTAFLALGGMVFRQDFITPHFLLIFWLLSSLLTIITKIVLRQLLGKIRLLGHNLRFIIIVGSGRRGQSFAERIEQRPWLGYRLAGFFDDVSSGPSNGQPNARILGTLDELPRFLSANVVDEVFIVLPLESFYAKVQQIICECEEQGIAVRLLMDFFDLKLAKTKVDHLDQTQILTLYTGPAAGWQLAVKRVMDLSIASMLLVLLAPSFLLVICLIKLTSPGPIFFRQERLGYNKRRFRLLKFRTMVQNAETLLPELESFNEVSGPVFKMENDPRLTKVGKFLRRTSIDELPQLINVIKGEMSLVGPRPPIPAEIDKYDRWQRRRLSIRPGITCLWQVNGRSNIPFKRWMELDLEYIDNWSLKLDLMILLRTIPAVIKGAGAL